MRQNNGFRTTASRLRQFVSRTSPNRVGPDFCAGRAVFDFDRSMARRARGNKKVAGAIGQKQWSAAKTGTIARPAVSHEEARMLTLASAAPFSLPTAVVAFASSVPALRQVRAAPSGGRGGVAPERTEGAEFPANSGGGARREGVTLPLPNLGRGSPVRYESPRLFPLARRSAPPASTELRVILAKARPSPRPSPRLRGEGRGEGQRLGTGSHDFGLVVSHPQWSCSAKAEHPVITANSRVY